MGQVQSVFMDLGSTIAKKVVPGGGFEPPTRGFSVRCSTPELPGLMGVDRGPLSWVGGL